MLNVEQDLRQRVVKMQQVGLHDAGSDAEPIPFVHPTLTDLQKVKLKAEKAAQEVFKDTESDYYADIEYNFKLQFWITVYTLSFDDEAAYKRHGLEYVEEYVNNYFGSVHHDIYTDYAIGVLSECGLSLKEINQDEEIEIDITPDDANTNL